MKKTLKIIGILILILILFRGLIFRSTIIYNEIGIREEIKITNQILLDKIKTKSENKEIGLNEIIDIANSITTQELSFTTKRTSNNPNELINTKEANCVGYSAMFNSIANNLIRQKKLSGKIEAVHQIGRLDFLGIDLHQFFDNAFFRNHDYNSINNLETGEVISIDPSLIDYLKIKEIVSNSESK
ncbi:MAG: hypothetical protein R2828_34125 [Saprospiraceae bacterium]